MALDRLRVTGGRRLRGEIEIAGAKNAALPMLAATLLTDQPCRLTRIPDLMDVNTMLQVLKSLGVQVQKNVHEVNVQAAELSSHEAPYDQVRKMRASVLLLGPLLARYGNARVSLPGGCAIGVRPIDRHLKAFQALGAEIEIKEGYVEAKAARLKGTAHTFEDVTVTGTINALFAASRAEGRSTFHNCACEPEVIAAADVLDQMGAKVEGAGTPSISIQGVAKLKGFDAEMIPDRIETGTYLVAGALTQGELFLRGARASDLHVVIMKLRETGTAVNYDSAGIRIEGKRPIRPIDIVTQPYPGFPTDMQAQFMVLLSLANGKSVITETIFENRFMHAAELIRMGAKLDIDGSVVKIEGVRKLTGAPLMATDLRASASLVLAGLAAEGVTEVLRIYHLDRGYENMVGKLKGVGAEIERIEER
jgi:UDP-N-acetylglucosamine 1-carboxyvinyltransferase